MSRFLAALHSEKISLWDAHSHSFIASLQGGQESISFSPDGNKLVAADRQQVQMFDLTNLRSEGSVAIMADADFINSTLRLDDIVSVTFSSSGCCLLISEADVLHYLDLISKTLLWSTSIGPCFGGIAIAVDDTVIFSVVGIVVADIL